MLVRARAGGGAVAAFNVVDDNSMEAILTAAGVSEAPVVVQMSVRVAEFWGFARTAERFRLLRTATGADAALHLDHCPSPDTAIDCLAAGWDSVLLDTSATDFADAIRATRRVVAAADELGGDVEGEFEPIGRLSGDRPPRTETDIAQYARFVEETGVVCVAPLLGTAHGQRSCANDVDVAYARALAEAVRIPLVLHGGSGTTGDVLNALVAAGVAKVNISTALKTAYRQACAIGVEAGTFEPLRVLEAIRGGVRAVGQEWIDRLRGVAWTAHC
ncbi:fructose-bisphosphate aldolase, class II [Lentzea fradiae]|uniref:Fructose-bisphosphate aldolase, class II n=2 Tax=Lentzea fradiae TaxID=200378 RepID=A0A1G8CSN6_9PSEU|nr:fructose-bisphosphate aldolase, class II [Lentzea fradiae]